MNGVYDTKANFVFDYLKEQILKGNYAQGENIVISRVANELDMSTIPVREALKRLQSEGLVEIIPHKGAQVTKFDQNKIREILEMRAVLEGYAARLACEKIDSSTLRKLYDMNYKMKEVAELGADDKYSNLNQQFHLLLYKATMNNFLYDAIYNLWDGSSWSKSIFAFYPNKMIESVEEHNEILDAIESKNPERAEQLTRQHKLENIDYYLGLSQK